MRQLRGTRGFEEFKLCTAPALAPYMGQEDVEIALHRVWDLLVCEGGYSIVIEEGEQAIG